MVKPKSRVLVVCCSGSELHAAAVGKFLRFLEVKCDLNIISVDSSCTRPVESAQHWLVEEVNRARKVVVFHSQESVVSAWHYTRSAGVTDSVSLQAFVTVLEMFADSRVDPASKLVNVFFSYTPCSCVVHIDRGQTYQLMDEFDEFLADIDGSSSVDSSSLFECKEGRELRLAIEAAAAHAAGNPPSLDLLPPDSDTATDVDSIDNLSLSRVFAIVDTN